MDPSMLSAAQNMTPEQAKEMLDRLSPEEREQVAQQQQRMAKGMADLTHLVTKLKPSESDPDAVVSELSVIVALATTPAMKQLGEDEAQLLGPTIPGDKAKEALSKLEDKLEELEAFPKDALNGLPECEWRNAVLLYWHMYKPKLDEFAAELPGEVDHWRGGANQIAIKLLVQSQMLMPQQRWVQVTLAVAKLSALMATALWSHDDAAAVTKMNSILAEDGLTPPKLQLAAKATPREANSDSSEVAAGQHVLVSIELTREHVSPAGSAQPVANNPQGIFEAYWLYVEGLKPEGVANSLIVAKPMVCTDLHDASIKAEAVFQAPPKPGTYTLRVHVTSTSVIGINLTTDVAFTVVEDDVPDLE